MTCPHTDTELVDIADPLGTDTRVPVARICTSCLTELPLAWGCTDCDWAEERRLCDPVGQLVLGRPCTVHQHTYLEGA